MLEVDHIYTTRGELKEALGRFQWDVMKVLWKLNETTYQKNHYFTCIEKKRISEFHGHRMPCLIPLIRAFATGKQDNPAKRLATVSIANAAFAFDFHPATAIGKATEGLRFGKREPRS